MSSASPPLPNDSRPPAPVPDKPSRKLRAVLSHLIEKLSLDVDYHGLADVYEAFSNWARIFWLLVVIGSMYMACTECYGFVMLFASHPTATTVSEFAVRYLELPTITVCNLGIFNRLAVQTLLNEIGESDQKVQADFIRYLSIMAYRSPKLAAGPIEASQRISQKLGLDANLSTIAPFMNRVSYPCDEFLFDCELSEEPFDCCNNSRAISTEFGTCYTIRLPDYSGPLRQTGRDELAGISFSTSIDLEEISDLGDGKVIGLRLFLDDPAPLANVQSVQIPPNTYVEVRLSAYRYLIDLVVNDCWVYEPSLEFHDRYTQELCKHDCMLHHTAKSCGCLPFEMSHSTSNWTKYRVCTIDEMHACVLSRAFKSNGSNTTDHYYVDSCIARKCLPLCTYWTNRAHLILSQLRSDTMDSNRRSNRVNVFFGRMGFAQTESVQLVDFESMVGRVGGSLGLWTGMSWMSLVQVCVYLCDGCWGCMCSMCSRRSAD